MKLSEMVCELIEIMAQEGDVDVDIVSCFDDEGTTYEEPTIQVAHSVPCNGEPSYTHVLIVTEAQFNKIKDENNG
jgi:hypothetical protein